MPTIGVEAFPGSNYFENGTWPIKNEKALRRKRCMRERRQTAKRPLAFDMASSKIGKVLAVSCDGSHGFSKPNRLRIRLIEGYGIEGDAHAGAFIQHRYLARRAAEAPNNRQVHLLQAELFDELLTLGFDVGPGQLGENITTKGVDLLHLPLGAIVHLGNSAAVELTGLRTPCGYIDKFRKGLKRAMIVRTENGITFRAGVLGIVRSGGDVIAGDIVRAEIHPSQTKSLPAI